MDYCFQNCYTIATRRVLSGTATWDLDFFQDVAQGTTTFLRGEREHLTRGRKIRWRRIEISCANDDFHENSKGRTPRKKRVSENWHMISPQKGVSGNSVAVLIIMYRTNAGIAVR